MIYEAIVRSPLGDLTLASNGTHITGLWIEGQKYFRAGIAEDTLDGSALPVIQRARSWLEAYFLGKNPSFSDIPLLPMGTPFQNAVWEVLREIPYCETVTYGQIAAALEEKTGSRTSARAVGAAVGRNPISILIPCHRVVGAGGSLTGYAGGISKKEFLLHLEAISKGEQEGNR